MPDFHPTIGREDETATLLFSLSFHPKLAWIRFRPTSSQPFNGFSEKIVTRKIGIKYEMLKSIIDSVADSLAL